MAWIRIRATPFSHHDTVFTMKTIDSCVEKHKGTGT
jgi:hypothetical protein